ncbi:MAG: ABC transporter substrate-binding protein [Armatimonadetes bacterium]|nr:ABC transporter substrate-binding protein [Armatimonadota bacterium]
MFLRIGVISVLAALVLAALALNACRQQTPVGRTPQAKSYSVLVSLSPSTSELVAGNGGMGLLQGRTSACDFPAGLRRAIVVVDNGEIDYEKLETIKPDLVIFDSNLYSDEKIAKIEQLGFEMMPMEASTLDEFIDYSYRLASKIGLESNISKYLDRVITARNTALSAGNPTLKVAIVIGDREGGYMIAGKNTFQADVVRSVGGSPVGPDASMFVALNLETLIVENPDIIISAENAADILADERFTTVNAIRNKRVFDFEEPAILLRAGKRVDMMIDILSGLMSLSGSEGQK